MVINFQAPAPTRRQMLDRLLAVQNLPVIVNQDILTITGFMNDVQMLAHVERYEAMAASLPMGTRRAER